MSEKKNFRKQFWKEKKTVGAMAPSSRFLTEKMLQHIDFKSAKVIIELGPGTGVFTDEIISRMRNDATLLVFEVNDSFFENLHKKVRDKRVHLIHDSAEKIEEYLQKYGFEKADVVVSSLPLAVFTPQLRNNILTASENALTTSGKYIQFQYSLQAKSLLKKLFKDVKIAFTPFNLPPAFVYTCTKKNPLH
ncbi:methyltransferase [Crocinitomicaceae bacterium CZZ-1]|uniref:Methyltransferase n=1 Tax=Taishania pollutisoli TaxID=2766479 RepID=A0A8J6P7C7_9FLAO|nr:rRNA adenine N-6-methyltransferase family protein [Taishania pollutisoli]MBC9813384.1 methyltransferase [Taishania pollutisoli]MBX2950722.1 methyltransferase [Crocinitomicaceae bacterium]NGF76591.1 methyltransferase [Fluviicola sp. SGL-29]